MKDSNSSRIVAAVIGAVAMCIVATIGLTQPIVDRLVDNYFPKTTPASSTPEITHLTMDSSTSPPQVSNVDKSMFAILVGVTSETAFSTSDAMNYTYMDSVGNVNDAITKLNTVFDPYDIVYVVHVPNLRITPGNPGACKLYMNDVEQLKEYQLGWIIGGDNIVPDQFESGILFCYGE